MDLSDNQMTALRNLARKQAGDDVDWINISDARALTELGLADRGRAGWVITEAGKQLLAAAGGNISPPPSPQTVPAALPLSPRTPRDR